MTESIKHLLIKNYTARFVKPFIPLIHSRTCLSRFRLLSHRIEIEIEDFTNLNAKTSDERKCFFLKLAEEKFQCILELFFFVLYINTDFKGFMQRFLTETLTPK